MKIKKKQQHISKTVGAMVGVMLTVGILFSVGVCVAMFYSLVTDQLKANCVNGTNVLAYHLERLREDEDINDLLDQLKEQTGCEFTIFEGKVRAYTTVMQEGRRAVGTTLSDELAKVVLTRGQSYVGKAEILGVVHLCSYVPTFTDGRATGLIFAGVSAQSATKRINTAILIAAAISVVLLSVDILWLARFMRRKVSQPLNRLTALASSMESGDLAAADLDSQRSLSRDEIGYLTEVMDHTMTRLKDYLGEIASVLASISQGDLTVRPTREYVGDFVSIRSSLEQILQKLNKTMSQITSSGSQVSDGAESLAASAQSLSQGSAEQAAAVDILENTFDAVSSRIMGTARQAKQTSGEMDEMGRNIEESNRKMQEMTRAMKEIGESSKEIEKIIKTIEDIAFQTNILALNAAVEAARAGAAGKGFAVVADEVRSLASKSQDASQSTASLIARAVSAVEQGSQIADTTAAQLGLVASGTKEIVASMDHIAEDAGEQADDVAKVREQISQIAIVVQANSATAEESAATSEELSAQAALLKSMVQQFMIREGHSDKT